jgi:universal stress protein A
MKVTANPSDIKIESAPRASAHAPPVFTRVLVPTDFSHRSEAAVQYAIEIARRMHAQLTLLHIVQEPSAFDYTLGGIPPGQWEQGKLMAEQKLAEETTRCKLSYREVDSLLRTGLDLPDEIIKTSKETSADLVVLSTHGYTGWKHFLLGSDAEKILEHARCPILVVR